MTLKLTLKAARVNSGLTQRELAEKLGKHHTTIVNWEKGNGQNISWFDFQKLCKVLKISPNDIFFN